MTILKFASTYENIPTTSPTEFYDKTSFFHFALTNRNWAGNTYLSKDEFESFIHELKEDDKVVSQKFNTENFIPFYFLIDVSVFSSKEVEGNLKLVEFLEDLEDFYETDEDSSDFQKRKNKYFSKLRYYASKPENLGYLYRWCFVNEEHPFVGEIKVQVEQEIEDMKTAFHKKFDITKLTEEQQMKFGTDGDALAAQYSKKEEEIISKLTKYSYSEPSLFLFNAYFVAKWLEHYKGPAAMFQSYFTITQYVSNKKVVTDIYQGQTIHQSCYMYQEMMGDFMGLISDDAKWALANLRFIDELPNSNTHEEVIKSIGKWAANKIYTSKRHKLPNKQWYVDVTWDYLKEVGIQQLTFIRDKEVMGPNGTELIVYAKASIGAGYYVVYPLIDPSNWDSLSAPQKALMTYTLCLYHDITVENAFNFEENESEASKLFHNPFVSSPKKLVLEGVKAQSKVKMETSSSSQSGKHTKHKPHREHWVTFHFRKLKDGESQASPQVLEKASKYDIDVPKGFTFIDAHIRGGDKDNSTAGELKVSALDMFSRTVSKGKS